MYRRDALKLLAVTPLIPKMLEANETLSHKVEDSNEWDKYHTLKLDISFETPTGDFIKLGRRNPYKDGVLSVMKNGRWFRLVPFPKIWRIDASITKKYPHEKNHGMKTFCTWESNFKDCQLGEVVEISKLLMSKERQVASDLTFGPHYGPEILGHWIGEMEDWPIDENGNRTYKIPYTEYGFKMTWMEVSLIDTTKGSV